MFLYKLVHKYDVFDQGTDVQYSFDYSELERMAKYLNWSLPEGSAEEYIVETVNSKYVSKY